ncbi:sulfotransferase family 2 domain-containing protein [Jannaschia ovalis]|uniref:Sulfotransferase family 2 domain-containing protein n=1 Tax=Jannaschia ovalis TaxID=3038773 RepID=A0ABY8LEX5_9RHOB|nr:sulfotransferase family 2 domain-containing protein [Jannaschia sp. GRR-S6-38]WGH79849.1 sulfotransferase family 2 domain-containing protein [Jannaschia sp. GRR-S6-38]
MPLYRAGGEIHMFCHVPKCGGASVESHLAARFGELAFLNSSFFFDDATRRWTKSSPQHVDMGSLEKLIPPGWISSSFAVVRHPVARLRSAYDYAFGNGDGIVADMGFNDWIRSLPDLLAKDPFAHDNHVRPGADLVRPGSKVFRLEDGLDAVADYLARQHGAGSGSHVIPHANKSRGGADYRSRQEPLEPDAKDLIARLYAKDFELFGYLLEESHPASRPRPSPRAPRRLLRDRLWPRKIR